ncbi:MAG: IS481 family transposase [Acidobacteria bacterium]|nr:MAG: IS481 family transposase [Acidobacteriota bacterium]
MKLHANAPLGPKGKAVMVRRVVEEGWSLMEAAEAAGISDRRCREWVRRYRAEGEAGLHDRSSAQKSVANRTEEARIAAIAALRRLRMTAAEIAEAFEMALSTVSGILNRIGLGKLSSLEPLEPPNRYVKDRPGELLHIDVKKLVRISDGAGHRMTGKRTTQARGVGWEFVHVCVDDATRIAYVEVLTDEKGKTAVGFLKRAVAYYRAHGITVEAVMTDNGSAYRSVVHAIACRALGLKHQRTRPYRPRTNGEAERFIRTMLGGWAYGAIYRCSAERTRALSGWLDFYNHRRRHGSLGRQPPFARLTEIRNNVVGSYI